MISEIDILIRILIAAGLGLLVGYERERQNQPAGLRTHIVLVTGAALAMVLSINLAMQYRSLVPNGDPARLAAQVLSGIGFLGAGAILRFGPNIKGLTTAASLWTMAVVGLAVGAGYFLTAGGVTLLLLLVLGALNWVESRLFKSSIIVHFTIYALDKPGLVHEVRQLLGKESRLIEHFRLNRHINRQRVRMDAMVQLRGEETLEKLSAALGEIKGVRIVKYE